ncbi:putative trans-sulfuration enzyme [Lachnellula hyalina]|uniref:Putative trans-sulfuration enzyme n=1 Tax=Lachnellula hyalina TaxID=1316788 RepID=A0A8H8R8M4_9HELO|nr:putative trans-sulfuration enzyme [Lachnellula hyalina]TVY30455.1 putative trans-sulfuration enzyme [Lachnellula hyalina]
MATSVPGLNGHQNGEDHTPDHGLTNLSLSSRTVHADDFLNQTQDVAPALHVSTTYRYNRDPDKLQTLASMGPEHSAYEGHVYSRHTAPNTTRFEAILSEILKGPSLTYSSGLSAFHSMLVFLNPKRIAIGEGYHGCHGIIDIHKKLTGLQKLDLDCPAEDLQPGDIVHVETPLNPTGEARNLKAYAEKAHSRGAFLTVDATFAPPPLQDPFLWGADIVMHSGTKYIGGHSDMLCGILAVNPKWAKEKWFEKLGAERLHLGNVMGNMEGWLGIRSVRTLEVRVEKQAFSVGKLVGWLNSALTSKAEDAESKVVQAVLAKIEHASLQEADIKDGWLLKQMPKGFGPVFSIVMKEERFAKRLPSKLELFHHATSLGGVESLIEWRTMTDSQVDTRLLRISIGIEGWEDLRDDLLQGFKALLAETK